MRVPFKTSLTRRELLKDTALVSSALLTGFEKLVWPAAASAAGQEGFSGARQLGAEKLTGDLGIKMDTVIREEVDCRRFPDLPTLTSEPPIIPTKHSYIRTG